MANDYQISAGTPPIDNSSGATAQSYYVSAGLIPDDTAVGGVTVPVMSHHYTKNIGSQG